MKSSSWPAFVAHRVLALTDAVAELRRHVADIERKVAFGRAVGDGRSRPPIDDPGDPAQMRVAVEKIVRELPELIREQGEAERRLRVDEQTLADVRGWLDRLPAGTTLAPVKTAVPEGASLDRVRADIKAAQNEVSALKAAPVPSKDIRRRAENYVAALAKGVRVRGVGASEKLAVQWPGALPPNAHPTMFEEGRCDALAMFAALFPEQMADLVLAEVERASNVPLPVAERPARIAALEAEIEELMRIEEALLARDGGERLPGRPAQVVLGVRTARSAERSAA